MATDDTVHESPDADSDGVSAAPLPPLYGRLAVTSGWLRTVLIVADAPQI
jgi:hypothetical protein